MVKPGKTREYERVGHPPEAYEKIDGGKGGSYQAGHNAAYDREVKLREQRPYLTQYNMGAGGRADDPHPQESYSIIIKK
jgi:hypothetical protein